MQIDDTLKLKVSFVMDTHKALQQQAQQLAAIREIKAKYTIFTSFASYKAEFVTTIAATNWDALEPQAQVKYIICQAWQNFTDGAKGFKGDAKLSPDDWQNLRSNGRIEIDFSIKHPKQPDQVFIALNKVSDIM